MIDRARRFSSDDRHGYQAEFIGLVERASHLSDGATRISRR